MRRGTSSGLQRWSGSRCVYTRLGGFFDFPSLVCAVGGFRESRQVRDPSFALSPPLLTGNPGHKSEQRPWFQPFRVVCGG